MARTARQYQAALESPAGPSTDVAAFEDACRIYQIKTKDSGLVRFDPTIWNTEQRKLDAERTGRDLVLKPRQVGISTIELLRGFHQVHTKQGWDVRVVIHDPGLADGLFDIVHLAQRSVTGAGIAQETRRDRVRLLEFDATRSSIAVTEAGATRRTAKKKGRSGTIHRLHATEVAFWAEPEESMAGLLGAVPKSGEVLIESTPNGAQGWFYDRVQEAIAGEGPYRFHFFPWWQHDEYRTQAHADFDARPRDEWEEKLRLCGCDDEQIQWWRDRVRELTLEKALQEYPESPDTCFRAGEGQWFDPAVIDAAAANLREPVRTVPIEWNGRRLGMLLVYRAPRRDEDFIVSGDVAEGVGGDGSAATVMSRATGEVCGTFWTDTLEPGDFGLALAQIGSFFNGAMVAPERNNHGHATLRALRSEAKYLRIYQDSAGRLGWDTSPITRPVMWDEAHRAVCDGHLVTPDRGQLAEMKTLVRGANGRPQARNKGSAGGAKDDRWTSLIIAWQVRQQPLANVTLETFDRGLGRSAARGFGQHY